MLFAKVVVFVTLSAILCLSETIITVHKPDGSAVIEEAALQLLTTCFADHDKTIVLIGEFPGMFVEKLSLIRSISIVLLDDRTREDNNYDSTDSVDQMRKHKVNVVVMMIPHTKRLLQVSSRLAFSQYDNSEAYVLILGSSNENRVAGEIYDIANILYNMNRNNMMNVNMMVLDRQRGVVLYTSTPFANNAPRPWRLVETFRGSSNTFTRFSYFVRDHQENTNLCENLEFDRGHDIGGSAIPVVFVAFATTRRLPEAGTMYRDSKIRGLKIRVKRTFSPILNFIAHVNATAKFQWARENFKDPHGSKNIYVSRTAFRNVDPTVTHTYPQETTCQYLMTQFRGNKSQLRKLYEVIDGSSWIGMYIVYLITLIYFKFFLRQPVIAGLLNLFRLTCNTGLPSPPVDHSSRIYMGCLLFFVVTMQGIFTGNLASLLTHDFPVEQVNSFQDLVNFDYTVGIQEKDLIYVDYPIYQGHLNYKVYKNSSDCVPFVLRDSLNACLTMEPTNKFRALGLELHVSDNCVATELVCNEIPWRWYFEKELNKFIRIQIEAHTVMPFQYMVDERRLIELDAEGVSLEPEVMTLDDMGFAFAILGFGLVCAYVTFIAELVVDLHNRKISTARVVLLN